MGMLLLSACSSHCFAQGSCRHLKVRWASIYILMLFISFLIKHVETWAWVSVAALVGAQSTICFSKIKISEGSAWTREKCQEFEIYRTCSLIYNLLLPWLLCICSPWPKATCLWHSTNWYVLSPDVHRSYLRISFFSRDAEVPWHALSIRGAKENLGCEG